MKKQKPLERNTQTDVPRRIYRSTIDRIGKHITTYEKGPNGERKLIKNNFNLFLIQLLDLYEGFQDAKPIFVTESFETLEEARGEAIKQHVKTKKPIKWPIIAIPAGVDGEE